jgi:hypothetical protein
LGLDHCHQSVGVLIRYRYRRAALGATPVFAGPKPGLLFLSSRVIPTIGAIARSAEEPDAPALRTPDLPDRYDSPGPARLERLPYGHPSSPYRDDGTKKPPVLDLKTVELPVEADYGPAEPSHTETDKPQVHETDRAQKGETDKPRADQSRHGAEQQPDQPPPAADTPTAHDAPTPSEKAESRNTAVGDASAPGDSPAPNDIWQKALPELQGLWQRHLERWPESERPPAERTGDEPGSWRGDGGQYLSARDNATASQSFERMRSAERDISPAMQDIEAAVPGAKLVGFDHRLKGEDRFKEKIAQQLTYKLDRPTSKIADSMPDTIRYTFEFSKEQYVDGYWAVRQNLAELGYELRMSRNTWDSADYKGINTRWITGDDQRFEVQFHTPESFEAKQFTHKAYERLRVIDPHAAEVPELEYFQREASSRIPMPDQEKEIQDYRRSGHQPWQI